MKYKVLIEEIYSKIVVVEAGSEEDATEIASSLFMNGEIDMDREIEADMMFSSAGVADEEDSDFYDEVREE